MCQIIQLIISMGTRECNLWRADILFVSNITVSYRWSRNRGDIDAESAAAGAQSWTEQSQQHLFSCHISSDRAVNKGPLRPPGPLHSRMQLGARFNSPLCSTAVNNGDIVRPPVLSLRPGRRLLN